MPQTQNKNRDSAESTGTDEIVTLVIVEDRCAGRCAVVAALDSGDPEVCIATGRDARMAVDAICARVGGQKATSSDRGSDSRPEYPLSVFINRAEL